MTLEQEIICVDSKLIVELDESKSGHVHFGDTFKILVKDMQNINLFEKWKASIYLECLLCAQHEK